MALAQQAVPDKGNEISLEATLLTPTVVQGRIITADALHTRAHLLCGHHPIWRPFHLDRQGQSADRWWEDVRLFFAEPPLDDRDWRQERTCTKAHGRLEIRELVATTELNEFLATTWPEVAQVFCLTRTIQQRGQVRTQTIYGISSLPSKQACAARLLALVRAHWRIENRLRLPTGCHLAGGSLPGAYRGGSTRPGSPQ